MSTTASIIIGFTPFHLIPMRELVPLAAGDVHLFHPHAGERDVFHGGRSVSFLGHCDSLRRSRWAKAFSARRDIDAILRTSRQVDLYVPHPFYPLANHAFFDARVSRRFIYQDGILNYYDARTPLGTATSRLQRRAKGMAIGAWFEFYAGHLSGIDARPIEGGFFTHPQRVVGAAKFPSLRTLDFQRLGAKAAADANHDVLFLDQPIESMIRTDHARKLRQLTIDYTNALGRKVFYKPHYTQRRATPCDPAWVALGPTLNALPAEWAVEGLSVAHVVSFCTSALANIAMCDDTIRCHATAASLIGVSVDGRPTDLGEVLSGLGVKVVDLAGRDEAL